MQIFVVVLTCFILPYNLGIELINQDLGDIQFQAKAGQLPQKYFPLTEQDESATEKVEEVMDLIQLVPKLDPFVSATIKPLGIDIHYLWLKGHVYMKNIVIAGIKQIIVHAVELRLQNLRIDLNISFPSIYFEGDFNLQARWSVFPMSCRTHIGVILKGLNISVSAGGMVTHAQPVGEVLQITSTDLKVHVQNVLFNLTNLQMGGSHEEVGLAFAQLFSSGGEQTGNLFDRTLKTALKFINNELLNVSVEVFKSYLLSTGY